MTSCMPQVIDLCRACREHISWPVTGFGGADQAFVSIEDGVWTQLTAAADLATVIGYFAGPNHDNPGFAVVVPKTSHVMIRVVTATETLTFEGGFIRLTP